MFLSENKNQPKLPEFVLITSNVRPSVGQFEKSRFLLRLDFHCFLGPPQEENWLIWQQNGNVIWQNPTSGALLAALPFVKPVVWFGRAIVNWRSRSVAKLAYCSGEGRGLISQTAAGNWT